MVIADSAFLVVDNPSSRALSTAGTGGNIISEGEYNRVKWNVRDSTGIYQIPFTTSATVEGGNSTKIPLTYEITSAGDTIGNILFSTYETQRI